MITSPNLTLKRSKLLGRIDSEEITSRPPRTTNKPIWAKDYVFED